MKQATINKVEQLAIDLKAQAEKFGHQERMIWAIKNNMSLYTVNRYMNGSIGSTIIAEKLLADIKAHNKAA